MWTTSTWNIHSKVPHRENPERPILSGPKAASITRPTPYRWEGWLPSRIHQKCLPSISMVQYVLLHKHLNMIPLIVLVSSTTASEWNQPWQQIWELRDNCPVFAMLMAIYHYVERIWRIIVTPPFLITYIIANRYYPGGPVNIYILSKQLGNYKKKG